LVDLVDKARDVVRAAVACDDVAIDVDVDRAITLDADAASLRQAIENALKNAIEAQRGRPGVVHVRARTIRAGAEIELEVKDSGVGMSDADLARLFVPHESNKEGGTGVGMVKMKEVVENMHNGEVLVTSREGEGTRIVLRLPGTRARGRVRAR
jgi:signal transduction histidine kinase